MTTIYKPVLIESAEQAEALPTGTPVLTILTDPGEEPRVVGADYIDDSFDEDLTPGGNWHCVALEPIEVEVEQIRETAGRRRSKTLYVTQWSTPGTANSGGAALAEGGGSR